MLVVIYVHSRTSALVLKTVLGCILQPTLALTKSLCLLAQFSHPAGTFNVAYTGSAVSVHMLQYATVPAAVKDPAVERVRVDDRANLKGQDSSRLADE